MSHRFPPSSPVIDISSESPQKGLGGIINSSILTLGKKRSDQEVEEYPTPDPSSSIGRQSSPVKDENSCLDDANSTYMLSSPLKKEKGRAKPIKIELDASDPSRLAIGRKKAVCNVILPCRKNISRQHAFISYVAERNEIKLECNGTNGLSVHLPGSMQLHLIKPFPTRNFYKLMTEESLASQNANLSHAKALQKNHNLISFALAKGESVTFPYIQETLVNFVGATVCLSLKEIERRSEHCNNNFDEENSTETEDELCLLLTKNDDFPWQAETPSMKLVPVEHSPLTEQISKRLLTASPITTIKSCIISHRTTPQSSFVINQPSTPKKLKRESVPLKNNVIQETPLPKDKVIGYPSTSSRNDNIIEKQTFEVITEKTRVLSSISIDESPRKRLKTSSNSNSKIFQSLAERGIICDDLVHVLCNHLAFSNLQQTPLSQLRDINSNTSQLSRDELREVLETIPCISIIVRTGKDASGKALENEYYYDIENDDNDERKILYNLLKGGSRLRSCRKEHKQYFWKRPTK